MFWSNGNYFKFGPVVQEEMSFNDGYILSSGGHIVRWSGMVWENLVEGILGYIPVKWFEFGLQVQEEM